MTEWRIQYQDNQGAIHVCFCMQECRPSAHEAIETVVQSMILAARTSMCATSYLTQLPADALSQLRIRSVSPANAITQIARTEV
jgi:hypothetical protein